MSTSIRPAGLAFGQQQTKPPAEAPDRPEPGRIGQGSKITEEPPANLLREQEPQETSGSGFNVTA